VKRAQQLGSAIVWEAQLVHTRRAGEVDATEDEVGVSAGAGADTGAGAGEKSQASRGGECGGGGQARSGVPLSSASRPRATAAPSRVRQSHFHAM
jgi:hypothetical protein